MPTALLGDIKAGVRFVGAGDSTPLAVRKVSVGVKLSHIQRERERGLYIYDVSLLKLKSNHFTCHPLSKGEEFS